MRVHSLTMYVNYIFKTKLCYLFSFYLFSASFLKIYLFVLFFTIGSIFTLQCTGFTSVTKCFDNFHLSFSDICLQHRIHNQGNENALRCN